MIINHRSDNRGVLPLFIGSITQIGILLSASKVFLRRAMPLFRILLPALIAGFGGLLAVVLVGASFGPNNFIYCFFNALTLGILGERYALAPHLFMRYARFGQ